MPESPSHAPLVWIDLEMTGLEPSSDTIMSLACFVTDADLSPLDATGHEAIVQHSPERLDRMDAWCTQHHGASGLSAACIASRTTAEDAAAGLLRYVQSLCPEPRRAVLAGNSVHVDARFLWVPPWDAVMRHLHYRILDVSALKEAAKRWAPAEVMEQSPRKEGCHEARADILESIAEAKFYRDVFFRPARLEAAQSRDEAGDEKPKS